MDFCSYFNFKSRCSSDGPVGNIHNAVKSTWVWTSLPNLWAFPPVSRVEIRSGIILETC